ncbi:unnamed protein product, partial [Durusdinium trenchii]
AVEWMAIAKRLGLALDAARRLKRKFSGWTVETYKLMISSYAQQDLIQVERVERAVEVKETETSQ